MTVVDYSGNSMLTNNFSSADLTAIYTINFSGDEKMFEAFRETWGGDEGDKRWYFDQKTNIATLIFGERGEICD